MTSKRVLITGGAGFIGCNAARYFGERNWNVTVLDNLSRAGTEKNLHWLRDGTSFEFAQVDVRDRAAVDHVFADRPVRRRDSSRRAGRRHDLGRRPAHRFRGECARHVQRARCGTALLPGSRIHLCLDQQGLRQDRRRESELRGNRYAYVRPAPRHRRSEPLDFLSPYGCSKGAADQYVLDFARIYGSPHRRSASPASTGRASSASRIRAGSPGS